MWLNMNEKTIDVLHCLTNLSSSIDPFVRADTVFIGIASGGVAVMKHLSVNLSLNCENLGVVDVGLHRDDFGIRGVTQNATVTDIPFNIDGKDIVLVDDVIQSGRTVRAAINELFDYGRPMSIKLATLIDRGGRQIPICPNFIGMKVLLDQSTKILVSENESEGLSIKFESIGKFDEH
jgi:pyrimidine operon attenuation protein/uracil phosphoribosyltransferase